MASVEHLAFPRFHVVETLGESGDDVDNIFITVHFSGNEIDDLIA